MSNLVLFYAMAASNMTAEDESSESDMQSHISIDFDSLPRPLPYLSRYRLEKFVDTRMNVASTLLQRPVTQYEGEAVAWWSAKYLAIYSYGSPLGVGAGLYLAYRGRASFQYPFVKPDMTKFQKDVFPAKLGWLKGPPAVIAHHATRALLYGYLGKFFGMALVGAYAISVAETGMRGDPRLTAVNDALRQHKKDTKHSGDQQERRPSVLVSTSNQYDDGASPSKDSHGPEDERYVDGYSGGKNNYGYQNASNTKDMAWEEDQQQPVTRDTTSQGHSPRQQEKPFDFFDEDSPTGGLAMTDERVPAQRSEPVGSAWDRIRRGETISPTRRAQKTPTRERRKAADGDSFTFSKTDEERSYAKEEAQKDFDARVEKERAGKNFGTG